ncbi:hypothetical protein HGM15179_012940 [Zosterops borbonicus]|uniref:Uncharacterized protein n=1 Tax=Zosterops borbonicus TaxID=364589 RepID=A0A8K1G9B1_9PASS|nr:hypothetical protein HGM15179_012940 [Zosterops borbonicus]
MATQTDPLDRRVLAEVPSSALVFSEERFDLVSLEFCNSNLVSLKGIHLDSARGCLAKLPEPYEILPLRLVRQEQSECEVRESDEPKTPEALPGTGEVPTPVRTPVVLILDKSPSCSRCSDQFNQMSGLIEHLKRSHRQSKIFFRCSKCGRQNLKYHSIASHVPWCKGSVSVVPSEEWVCEVCSRSFATKVGLAQHKRFKHPLVQNRERIKASHPKMAKQISDKRRLLGKGPSRKDREIEDGDIGREEPPRSAKGPCEGHLELHYQNILELRLSAGRLPGCQEAFKRILEGEADNISFHDLITEKEVGKNVDEVRKTSAPGPDGITLGHLLKLDPRFSQLSVIFNLWLVTGIIPDALQDCRTVLIPKSSSEERLGDINNWRPITIASLVFRLFSRIATARLSHACPIHPRQQSIISASGCSENLKLLQLLVKSAKQEHCHLGVVFVDIAKAFDTVSHRHIIASLTQRGVDPHVVHLVSEMYRGITTYIITRDRKTDPININSSVKQGDPM